MRPGELGCFTTRMRINSTTKLGKRSRKPNGIEMEELPFTLIRLRKNDNRGSVLDFSFFESSADSPSGTEGKRLSTRCTKPIIVARVANSPGDGGLPASIQNITGRACNRC